MLLLEYLKTKGNEGAVSLTIGVGSFKMQFIKRTIFYIKRKDYCASLHAVEGQKIPAICKKLRAETVVLVYIRSYFSHTQHYNTSRDNIAVVPDYVNQKNQ